MGDTFQKYLVNYGKNAELLPIPDWRSLRQGRSQVFSGYCVTNTFNSTVLNYYLCYQRPGVPENHQINTQVNLTVSYISFNKCGIFW
ncbi:MAG: hypothetical protein V7L14_06250 [Nostoc sp.]|uniref:hypothetical protein n=1 Tax=Nostoc sp. TaxID=1180 RepID=UPI002FFB8125